MAKNSSVNLDITNNVDGFSVAGGNTKRGITVTGGDVSVAGGGGFTYTFPSASGTLALTSDIGSGTQSFVIMLSDMTTAIQADTTVASIRMPYAFTLTGVRAFANTAPTGANIIIDINASGTSILSPKLVIDAGSDTSVGSATTPGIIDNSLLDNEKITFDIDQVGSTVAGAGLGVVLIGTVT